MGDAAKCTTCGRDIPPDAPGGACPRCALAGAMPAATTGPTAEEVAAKLPGFEILGVLGSGGMGVVFKARQKALDRIVALKVLPPATAATPGFAERFGREAKAMARLSHPNIVAVYEFGESGGLYYLVLEFVDGLNVREAMTAGRIRPGEALTIVPQICDALQYAHDRGVVHRDIKPENVMIDRDGRVKIADFGLAKLADRETGDPSLTGAGQVMGTLRYMAPEQWERPKEVDHRADIYSLGVVFYEMLTGELPMGKFEPPSAKARVDVRIDDVVMRAIERDRERRWQHASEVKTQMGVISAGAAVGPAPVAAATSATAAKDVEIPSLVPVVVPFLVAVIATVAAFIVSFKGWSVLCSAFAALCLIGGVVKAIQRHETMRRLGLVKPKPTEEEKLSEKVRKEKALEAIEAEAEPEPRGRWLPGRTVALVTLAGILAAAALCGGFGMGPAGMTVSGILFVLGLVLWHQYDERKKAVVASEKGEREHPGPPVAIEVLSAVMIVVGVVGIGYAMFGHHEADDDEEGTHIKIGPFGIRASSKAAKPKDPPKEASADRAPWEFLVEATSGETPPKAQLDAQRQGIWKMWTKAQALQSSEWNVGFGNLYPNEDFVMLGAMAAERRKASADEGLLGVPLFPRERAQLGKFRIESARLGGWDGRSSFTSAVVRATDDEQSLRFTMTVQAGVWLFAAAPVELE